MAWFDQTTTAFIVTRTLHYSACLVLLTTFAFELFVISALDVESRGAVEPHWRRIARNMNLVCIPLIFVSGAAWFGLVAADMNGTSWHDMLQPEVLAEVWSKTQFGTVWQLRGLFWLGVSIAILGALLFPPPVLRGRVREGADSGAPLEQTPSPTLPPSMELRVKDWNTGGGSIRGGALARLGLNCSGLLCSAALCGSLAWAGHGSTGLWPRGHLAADVIHLVVSGVWPAGLLPFAWLLLVLRRMQSPSIALLVRRFSAMSLTCVLLLSVTGLVNSWALLGRVSNLVRTGYGKMLLFKIALFLVMVVLGAVNLLYLKPRVVQREGDSDPSTNGAVRALQLSVATELLLGVLVIVVVGMLGLLPPGAE